jgi:hypothetical protein
MTATASCCAAKSGALRTRKLPLPERISPVGSICSPPSPPAKRITAAFASGGEISRKRCVTPARVGMSTTRSDPYATLTNAAKTSRVRKELRMAPSRWRTLSHVRGAEAIA